MRFLYVADTPWWAISRHAFGLKRYDDSKSWDVAHCSSDPDTRESTHLDRADFSRYDLVVFGCLPIWWMMKDRLAKMRCPILVTMASFRDARGMTCANAATGEELDISGTLRDSRIAGIVINDSRMTEFVVRHELPIIFHPDRVDTDFFYPVEKDQRRHRVFHSKALIGWAGSTHHWQDQKHLELIEQICEANKDEVELVLQRREVEGLKNQDEMVRWYHSLDAYICMNDELTPNPVPVLEALACGLPVFTTACGDLAPLIEYLGYRLWGEPAKEDAEILRDVVSIWNSLHQAYAKDSNQAHQFALNVLSWASTGEADRFTRICEEVARCAK